MVIGDSDDHYYTDSDSMLDYTFYIHSLIVKMVSKAAEIIPSHCGTEILNSETADPRAGGFIIVCMLHIVGCSTELQTPISLHPPVRLTNQVAAITECCAMLS